MGAEEGRHDVDRALATEPVGRIQQPDLGLDVQSVAGLRLDRRDAVPEHLVEPAPAVDQQVVGGRGAGGGNGGEDAAAGGQDLEVAGAALAQQQLPLPSAAEQQVRVVVDEPG
jgi:hypothetical protein